MLDENAPAIDAVGEGAGSEVDSVVVDGLCASGEGIWVHATLVENESTVT